MTPQEFIAKWRHVEVKESAVAQSHFNDLCALIGEPTPLQADPTGADYGFEKLVAQTTGRQGFADVFRRGCFAWEYKTTRRCSSSPTWTRWRSTPTGPTACTRCTASRWRTWPTPASARC
jgi:hypothetical protein